MNSATSTVMRRNLKPPPLDTLPGYSPSPDLPFENPPEYPGSANSPDQEHRRGLITPPPPTTSPGHRRTRSRPINHKSRSIFYRSKAAAASDSFLDSLLERSIRALEMSNALLQSSMSQPEGPRGESSGSSLPDHVVDHTLQMRAQALSSRIHTSRNVQETWMNDLTEIVNGVEDLFGDHDGTYNENRGISSSLPASESPLSRRNRTKTRRASVGHRAAASGSGLRYAADDSAFRSPPPRALTQYVSAESVNDFLGAENPLLMQSVVLPSTLGLRSGVLSSPLPSPPIQTKQRSHSHDLISHPSKYATKPSSFSNAHSFLSDIAARSPPLSSPTHSRTASPQRAARSSSETGRMRGRGRSRGSTHSTSSRESSSSRRSGSPLPTLEIRPMTPTQEETTPPSTPSSTQEESQAVEYLRKILKEAPNTAGESSKKPTPPSLIVRTHSKPSEPQEAATTASISRLLTKAAHHSSMTTPPPTHSSLKRSGSPMLSSGQITPGSSPSSGRSTPRLKVQFAELPESYSSTKPGPKPSRAKSKRKKGEEPAGWWKSFWSLGEGTSGSLMSSSRGSRFEERVEDKVARSWGRPGFSSGLDDWSI